MKSNILILFLLLLSGMSLSGQDFNLEVLAADGECFSSGSISGSYTLGEVVIGGGTNGNLNFDQGFQQSDNGIVATTARNIPKIEVFPNPSFGIFTIKCNELILEVYLYSDTRKLILKSFPMVSTLSINMTRLNTGMYYLRLVTKGKSIFRKIVKVSR